MHLLGPVFNKPKEETSEDIFDKQIREQEERDQKKEAESLVKAKIDGIVFEKKLLKEKELDDVERFIKVKEDFVLGLGRGNWSICFLSLFWF